ncbi:methyl-accepting chemotaxis protein [Chromobacterium sp. IIBBL 290-4]|uniref:methyl-accepting chemotaxis protein n=1 Tax=Chromobacterium sp. IIBBL 290-4 TaxID=2953890 RepID=UPI0020B8190C|nr:methyl-accepting chemotaxis protein [Chromobacterium sp. IIBBL 290-4]UTH76338.1 methyl-accepting chemotaxis protein [Chromobacterium sp. IIBBL 290-4]
MRNLSIAARITLGFALLLAALIMTGLLTQLGLGKISKRVEDVSSHDLAFYTDIVELQRDMGNLRRFEKDYFINIANDAKRGEYIGKWKTAQASAQKAIQQAGSHPLNDESTQRLNQLATLLGGYADGVGKVSAMIESKQITATADANKELEKYKDNIHQMEGVTEQLGKSAADAVGQLDDQIDATASSVRSQLMVEIAIALAAGVAIAWFIIASIRQPLLQMRDASQELAEQRNLRLQLPDFGQNELGNVAGSLAKLVDSVRTVVVESQSHSASLAQAARQLSSVSEHVSSASAHQSEAASSGAAAIEQMSVSINLVADSTLDVERQARLTMEQATAGSDLAQRAAGEIRQVANSITETATVMDGLNQRSADIGDIVRVIHDIADQTNLLALNAAIEAARAGEMGRGFAVVADEVRKLAERTSQATTEITGHIDGVQADTQRAFQSMQQANSRIETGVVSASSVAEALQQIRELAEKSVDRIADISNAIKEQSHASQEVARNVEQIAQMNSQTTEAAGEASGLAAELNGLSNQLDGCLQRFRT